MKKNRKALTGILIFTGGVFTGFGIALWIGRSVQKYDEKKEEFRKQALKHADQAKKNHNIDGLNENLTAANNQINATISKPEENDVVQQLLYSEAIAEFLQKYDEMKKESDE